MHAARQLGLDDARCHCCSRVVSAGDELCETCSRELAVRLSGFCPYCGAIFENADQKPMRCGQCRLSPRPWGRVLFHGVYEGTLRELIISWKYLRSPVHMGLLERLAADCCSRMTPAKDTMDERDHAPGTASRGSGGSGSSAALNGSGASAVPCWDVTVPVPLHPRRLRWRGFNQSLELARAAARRSGCAVAPQGLRRIRETTPQTGLSESERKANIKGAFTAPSDAVRQKRVLLVDDVLTTGATLDECARTLTRAGASSVDVLVLARARGG